MTLAGVELKIQQYEEKFKEIKTRFNERGIVQIDIMLLRCLEQVQSIQSVINRVQSQSEWALLPSLRQALIRSSYDPDD